jgi:hypothetical protein
MTSVCVVVGDSAVTDTEGGTVDGFDQARVAYARATRRGDVDALPFQALEQRLTFIPLRRSVAYFDRLWVRAHVAARIVQQNGVGKMRLGRRCDRSRWMCERPPTSPTLCWMCLLVILKECVVLVVRLGRTFGIVQVRCFV